MIFCEGANREPEYFKYFRGLSSQIKILPIPAEEQGNNSPTGLLATAKKFIEKSDDNPSPEYEIDVQIDQVWFVIDTDKWGDKINELKTKADEKRWFVAQSNPCFEVWLYFHHYDQIPEFTDNHLSTTWKTRLNGDVPGGFDHRKHPIYIESAIKNARLHFDGHGNINIPPCTNLFQLASEFFPFVKEEIDKALAINFVNT